MVSSAGTSTAVDVLVVLFVIDVLLLLLCPPQLENKNINESINRLEKIRVFIFILLSVVIAWSVQNNAFSGANMFKVINSYGTVYQNIFKSPRVSVRVFKSRFVLHFVFIKYYYIGILACL